MLKQKNEKVVQLLKQRFQDAEDGAQSYADAREYALVLLQSGCLKDAREAFLQIQAAQPTNPEAQLMLDYIDTLLH